MSNIQDSSAPTDLVEQIPGRDPFLDDSEDHESGSGESQQEEIALPSPGPSSVPLNMSKPISPSPSLPQVPSRTVSSPPRPVPTSHVPAPSSPTPAYIPRLTAPSMFLPVPNTDPLSALLTKHVPPERRPRRDVVGEWTGRDMHEMVMSNSWRALAKMAHDRIVKSDPEDLARILDLWSLRLSSLARLRLTNQASAECTNLFAVLNAVPPQHPPSTAATTRGPSDPSGMSLFHARVHYWTGDTLGYVDALSGILGTCKERARILAIAEANLSMWLERTARVCLILASQLVEMKDYQAAITLLTPLCTRRDPSTKRPIPSPAVYSAVGRIYLIAGNVPKAVNCFEIAASCYAPHKKDQNSSSEGERPQKDTVAMNDALLSAALGNWDKAEEALRGLLESEPENFTAMNNLAVALFGQGRITEGIELLEAALRISPSTVVVAEPFLFNLSTLYELRSATAIDKKRELLIEVAKWSGDGLKTTCLKMPSN
ncbi:hypothetical protein F5I97DRAFT_1800098 [Phlebopus sp. FC_14]|nr:hypothetical protein F5I97DRAFT_1800098 [Phlebopus sp. FC_14]